MKAMYSAAKIYVKELFPFVFNDDNSMLKHIVNNCVKIISSLTFNRNPL